jgi:leader peptidase (prepilin peptidase) / N-methyltransferase
LTTAAVVERRAPLRPTRAGAAALASIGVAAVCLVRLEPSGPAVVQAAVAGLLVWLAAIDLEFRLVPNRIVLPASAAVLLITAAFDGALAAERLVAAVGAGALLLVAALLRPGDLGLGDVKLVVLIGAVLGGSVLTALLVGFAAVAVAGVALVARTGKSALRRHIPLVPFLALGAIVTILARAPV